jgi:spore germination protein
MEDVIEYSITKISKEKIWLGIHLYGYMWKGSEATAFTPATYKSIVENPNVNTQFKEDVAEGYAEYSCDGTTCYLYYQSKEGVNIRRQLALEYELAGVSYWSLGRDDGLLSVD